MTGTIVTNRSNYILHLTILFIPFFLACYVGLNWAMISGAGSPIWPAAGVGLAGLILGGVRLWPALVLGRILAAFASGSQQPIWAEAAIAIANGVSAVVPFLLIRHLGWKNDGLTSLPSLLYFLAACLLGAFLSASLGAVTLFVSSGLDARALIMVYANWLTGNFVGAITIGPLILAWSRQEAFSRGRLVLLAALLVVTFALSLGVFFTLHSELLRWHLLPLLVAAALLFDVRGASIALLIVFSVAVWGTSANNGPFAALPGSPQWHVFLLQQFIATIAITVLMLAIIADERRAKDELKWKAERLRAALDAGGSGTFRYLLPEGILECDDALLRVLGLSRSTSPQSLTQFLDLVSSNHRGPVEKAWNDCSTTQKNIYVTFETNLADGPNRVIELKAKYCPSSSGKFCYIVGACTDVTERESARARELLLSREVDHRAKNIMSVVQAIVSLTKADDVNSFRTAINGRINSMARTHKLLATNRWDGADLCNIIADELNVYQTQLASGEDRIRMTGNNVTLSPEMAQSIALVIHELATNAVKYGSLSMPTGLLNVHWRVDSEKHQLNICWEEKGSMVQAPPSRTGFGMTLIQTTIVDHLGGEMTMSWAKGGLSLEISACLNAASALGSTSSPVRVAVAQRGS